MVLKSGWKFKCRRLIIELVLFRLYLYLFLLDDKTEDFFMTNTNFRSCFIKSENDSTPVEYLSETFKLFVQLLLLQETTLSDLLKILQKNLKNTELQKLTI